MILFVKRVYKDKLPTLYIHVYNVYNVCVYIYIYIYIYIIMIKK